MKHVLSKSERDKAVVLATVRKFGPLSRVDIHELTNLRPSTISVLVRELLDSGKVREAGTSDNPLGRKQVLLEINENYGYVVGVEVDPNLVIAAVMDLTPRIISMVSEPTRIDNGLSGMLEQLISCTRNAIEEAGFSRQRPLGITFADVGVVNPETGRTVQSTDIDFWKDVPVLEVFQEEFQCPFLLDSNTRCRALAERALGAGQMANDMIFIDYRAGIGAGIFSDGRMIRGNSHAGGEFGHTHVLEGGPPCKCGSFGCLEAVAGGSAIAERARKALAAGGTSKVSELAGGIEKIKGQTVLKAASMGDKMSMMLVEELGNNLGLGIANLVNLFDPSTIILNSNLELGGPALLNQIKWVVRGQSLRHSGEHLEFRYGSLGEEGGVLGAGLMIVEHLFEIPALKPPRFMIDTSANSWRGPYSSILHLPPAKRYSAQQST